MLRAAPPATVLACVLLLAACSSEAPRAQQPPLPSADPCVDLTADRVPAQCLPDTGRPRPSGPPPSAGSAAFAPLTVDARPGELARGGNDVEVGRTSRTFRVTVRRGSRLRITAACEGRTTVTVTTVPDSGAAFAFDCGFQGAPVELGVEDPTPVAADTSYVVTAGAPAPARWFVSIGQTDAPVPR